MAYHEGMHTIGNTFFSTGALDVLRALETAGFEAWFVGGCVRDACMRKTPHDFDMATNAHWQQVRACCATAGFAVHETGIAHGTVTIVAHGEPVEVTTYRAESTYSDRRHPDYVRFVDSIDEDLARRDFTMNALAFHPKRGLRDPFNGASDIQRRVIAAVGVAQARFEEDPLRIMRGARFAAQTGFDLDARTHDAMHACANLLDDVARERIGSEMLLLIEGAHAHDVFQSCAPVICRALARNGALGTEIIRSTAPTIAALPLRADIRLAALLRAVEREHEDATPLEREPGGRACGSAAQGSPACIESPCLFAQPLARDLRLARNVHARIMRLISLRNCRIFPTHQALRIVIAYLQGNVALAADLFNLQKAETQGESGQDAAQHSAARVCLEMMQDPACAAGPLTLRDLAVSGAHVSQWAHVHGGAIGFLLKLLLLDVIEERVENTEEALHAACLKHAREFHLQCDTYNTPGNNSANEGNPATAGTRQNSTFFDPIEKSLKKCLT